VIFVDLIQALLLGIIQGFTEWLPVSSSGHLVIAHYFLDIPFSPDFDIALMLGTSVALIIFFRKKILWLFFGILNFERSQITYLKMIIIAGVPTAIIGFAFRDFFKSFFSQPLIISFFILITGIFLLFVCRFSRGEKKLSKKGAFFTGLAQGLAVMPGISRSGSTIGTAMLFGLKAEDAAEFSFLIGLPAMLIASLIEFASAYSGSVETGVLFVGVISSLIFGYISIAFLMSLLKKNKLHYFGYYCVVAGAVFILLILFA